MLYDLVYLESFEDATYDPAFQIVDGDFVRVTTQAKTGTYSFSNKDIADSQLAYFVVKFTIPTVSGATWNVSKFSFDYMLSTEANYDFFNVYVDGTRLVHDSGAKAWQSFTTANLSVGDHLAVFEYRKDSSVSAASDSVFVDNLSLMLNYQTP